MVDVIEILEKKKGHFASNAYIFNDVYYFDVWYQDQNGSIFKIERIFNIDYCKKHPKKVAKTIWKDMKKAVKKWK